MKRILGYGVVLLLMIVLTAQTGIAFEIKKTAMPDLKQLEAAAWLGGTKAMYELGKCYEDGVGVTQNYVQAHLWYNVASSRGYTDAPKARDAVAKKMNVNQLEKAQELAANWKPSNHLSPESIDAMIKYNGFFDDVHNKTASGYSNAYLLRDNGHVVYDLSCGLMWEQSGSKELMNYDMAKKYVAQLNRDGFAGYSDWRLPTLEEAMTLMEPEKIKRVYIDPIFDSQQRLIWTFDLYNDSKVWCAFFACGTYCYTSPNDSYNVYVRAVRSNR